ncbi:MAG: serine/threonine protein kinase [Deltaproteobacteria bacterium]|nr:serine/threonine protein kinase [Deltaproteobacteria bacterium]
MICISCGKQFQLPNACPDCGWDINTLLDENLFEPDQIIMARYSIIKFLGTGRFGVSYLARDSQLNKRVVLKFIHPGYLPNQKLKKRFLDNMNPLIQNRFDMIVRLLNTGVFNDLCYISNEYVAGISMENLIDSRMDTGRSFAINEIYPILRQLSLFSIESACGPHGFLSPHNILILPGNLKVLDCGLVTALPPDVVAFKFMEEKKGKRYVAPELFAGKDITLTSDVYSLGVILAEMLTCKKFNDNPIDFLKDDMDLTPSLQDLLLTSLSKNPQDRYRDAEILLSALCDVAGLPMPHFTKNFDDESFLENGLVQEDKTAQIIMSDVIQQHYEEVTAVTRNPLLKNQKSGIPGEPSTSFKAPPPVIHKNDAVYSDISHINQSPESDIFELSLDDEIPRKEVTVNISIDEIEIEEVSSADEAVDVLKRQVDIAAESSTQELLKHSNELNGVDPRLVRAAFASETEKRSHISPRSIEKVKEHKETLNGIDPRFIRAAAKENNDRDDGISDDDWRQRIATDDSVVSFLSPSIKDDSKVQGFPPRPQGGEFITGMKHPAPPRPPVPRKR